MSDFDAISSLRVAQDKRITEIRQRLVICENNIRLYQMHMGNESAGFQDSSGLTEGLFKSCQAMRDDLIWMLEHLT